MCCEGCSPWRSATVRPRPRSPSTLPGSNATPHASSSGPSEEERGTIAIGPPCWPAGSFSDCGSTNARSLPPRMTNWSIAYSVFAGRSFGWISSSTSTSWSIAATSAASVRSSSSSRSCAMLAQPGRIWPESWSNDASTGSADMTADRRLLRIAEAMDQARHVVLEELFLVRLEEADDLAAVGRVRAGEAEVQRFVARAAAARPAGRTPRRGPRPRRTAAGRSP